MTALAADPSAGETSLLQVAPRRTPRVWLLVEVGDTLAGVAALVELEVDWVARVARVELEILVVPVGTA